jgi:predicted nucleic acid-binding protein
VTRVFIDSNILLYSISNDPVKLKCARNLISDGPTISTQVLNEFVNVARRKLNLGFETIEATLTPIRYACSIVGLTVETHDLAFEIARRAGLNIYDACIVAAAQLAGCNTLFTEDLNSGQRLGSVTIRNPFAVA